MDDTTKGFFETVIAGQVRHVMTGAAMALVTHGAMQSDQTNSFVQIGSGLAMYVVGAGWSWWQKSGQELVRAQLGKLRHHVEAIPVITVASVASPSAIRDVTKVNEAVSVAKEVATATPAEAAEIPPPLPADRAQRL